jgi:hypothetical protein
MSDYNEYRSHEIQSLNQTKLWRNTPIAIQSKERTKDQKDQKDQKYVLHATNDATLNGRKYVALPSDVNVSDPEVKKKFNLL